MTVRFGGLTALDAVSLAVPPRHVLGVIGPNGAGKTTLLNVLCGFIRPDAGEVLFGGRRHDVRPHRLAGLGAARTLQGVGLYGGLTALENVMVGATARASAGFWSALLSLPRASRDERELRGLAMAALDRVGAVQAAQARPGELPYGMRKRVALARALVAEPGLILLDEPASGLDESELAELGGLIRDLATEGSLVVVEHHMDLMMSVCDSIVVLDFGRVIPELTVEENLRVGMMSWPRSRSRADRSAALDEAYQRFRPLAGRRRKLASTLSGGERQMLVIARALLARPRVLLLDEPSLGLAPRVMAQVMDLVVPLSREQGLTIVLVEQNARSALAIADHGVVLNLGRVVASAQAATLAADVALRHHYLGF